MERRQVALLEQTRAQGMLCNRHVVACTPVTCSGVFLADSNRTAGEDMGIQGCGHIRLWAWGHQVGGGC